MCPHVPYVVKIEHREPLTLHEPHVPYVVSIREQSEQTAHHPKKTVKITQYFHSFLTKSPTLLEHSTLYISTT